MSNDYEDVLEDRMSLAGFAREVMLAWPDDGVDGGELQRIAVKHGVLIGTRRITPCADNCFCAEEYGVDGFPLTCYKKSRLIEAET